MEEHWGLLFSIRYIVNQQRWCDNCVRKAQTAWLEQAKPLISIDYDEPKSAKLRIMTILDDDCSDSSLPALPIAKQLRLVIREEEDCDNLFVRLSSGVASDLLSLSRQEAEDGLSRKFPLESRDAWTCFEEVSGDCISFLPLCISFGGNVSAFASYNGGNCAPYLEKGMSFQHLFTFDDDERFRSK